MRARGWALAAQKRHADTLRRAYARTAYGKTHGIEAGMSEQTWRQRVPLCIYEDFAPSIERMMAGEADVLWPGRCRHYATSSGITGQHAKCLPVTAELLAHFRRAGTDTLLLCSARTGRGARASLFGGKHVLLGAAIAPPSSDSSSAQAMGVGDISGFTALHLPAWASRSLYEPGAEIARLEDWPAKLTAIAKRCAHADVRLLAGRPDSLLELAAALLAEARNSSGGARVVSDLRELWPNFEYLVHSSLPLGPFAAELRAVCGPSVRFHEIYAASEAFIAAQDVEPEAGLRLLADAGVYFEFLPVADYDKTRLAQLGPKAIPLEGVKAGADYVLILSTPAGLVRYVLGDIVRFTSTEPARLVYAGRTCLQLNAFGEGLLEKELTAALAHTCNRHAWRLANFHVAPKFTHSLTSPKRGSHEWWVELRPGTIETPTGPVIAAELDQELQRLHQGYQSGRREGMLLAPTVRLVMPGVFEQWQREVGRWGGQYKTPRCRSDRQVADALAKFAPFHDVE